MEKEEYKNNNYDNAIFYLFGVNNVIVYARMKLVAFLWEIESKGTIDGFNLMVVLLINKKI